MRVVDHEFRVHNMRTRFPFKFGIASMTALPHLFLLFKIEVNGCVVNGVSSEGLPPKWFTKDPDTAFSDDLVDMIEVIKRAAETTRDVAANEISYFNLWRELHKAQSSWASGKGLPPLLANLGVSMVERACLNGLCRAADMSFHGLLRDNLCGIDLGLVRPELAGMHPVDIIAPEPLETLSVRHTVGLGDALSGEDLAPGERVDDGLPQTLAENIDVYGLNCFKVKLCGDPGTDLDRLKQLGAMWEEKCGENYSFTLDGNENFTSLEEFVDCWNGIVGRPGMGDLMRRLLFVEQPVHRKHALQSNGSGRLAVWENRPPMIIDESDGELDDLNRALAIGYDGVSYKNCKGVVKGLSNCGLIRLREQEGLPAVFSGEDLCNVGPVALLEDLAALATFGVTQAERNGHHYCRGLSMFPAVMQEAVLGAHGDLYVRHPDGFATLRIAGGRISTRSVAGAAFGLGFEPELSEIGLLDDWSPETH